MSDEKLTTIYSQHTIHVQRVGATEGLKVIPYLESIENDVVSILNKYRKRRVTIDLQVKIQDEIDTATRKHLQDYTSQLKVENRELGTYEGEFAASTLNGLVENDEFKAVAPTAAAVNSIATITPVKLSDNSYSSYSSMMRSYWGKWSDEVHGVVLDGFRKGQTIPEITNAITAQMDLSKSGTTKSVLDRARRSARQLAITGTNHYANTARIAFVDKNDDILKGYRFLAVNDSRTSRTCARLDQTTYAKDDPKLSGVTPPLHPYCRSALTFDVDDRFKLDASDTKKASSFEVDGKREGKPVDSDSIYYENLKKLGERKDGWKDIDAVIGPTLGKALRKMDAREFAKQTGDSMNNPLTIKQMKASNNELGRILRSQ
jgi:SPP1 gp7 family putative phage head morphogenesis protein